jgi:hypothetical protein
LFPKLAEMIGRRQRDRPPAPFASAGNAPPASEGLTATTVSEAEGWLPANASRTPAVVSPVATPTSWLPEDLETGTRSPTLGSGGATSAGEWLTAAAQAAATKSSADSTAATTALVPEEWLVADAPPISAPVPETAAPPPLDETAVPTPLLRFGLPLAVVAVSLVVALGIAGVFQSSPSRPTITPSGAAPAATPAAPSAATVRPASAAHRAAGVKPARSRHTSHQHPAHGAPPQPAASRSTPAASPTPSPTPRAVPPVTVPRTPVAPAPAHQTPAAPQRTTPPRHASQTRPTQRSGAPGRQPTSG